MMMMTRFTRATYRAARVRAIDRVYQARDAANELRDTSGEPAALDWLDGTIRHAYAIVHRGRREKGMWS